MPKSITDTPGVNATPHPQPTWTERYQLGVEMNRNLDPICTLDEIAAELGTTRQGAYTETVLALGALAWALRRRFQQDIPPEVWPLHQRGQTKSRAAAVKSPRQSVM